MSPSGGGGERGLTLGAACEFEGRDAPDLRKDVCLYERLEFARVWVRLDEFDALPSPRDADLLLLGAAKVSHAGGGDGRAWNE